MPKDKVGTSSIPTKIKSGAAKSVESSMIVGSKLAYNSKLFTE